MNLIRIAVCIVGTAVSLVADALALPVIPGALGFGSHTVAGRGGQVYRVTNLSDSGPGSLRDGVENVEGPRIIVFEVSGVIELHSDLVVRPRSEGDFGFLTIAGQTAPEPGITLKSAGISVRNRDVLIQHIAVRPGTMRALERLPDLSNRDAIKIEAPPGETTYNVVVDHVSCSWATDDTVSAWSDAGSIHDVMFQHCIFSAAIRDLDRDEPTGHGALAGRNARNVSFVGNLMALNRGHNVLLGDTLGAAEVVNNVIDRTGIDQDSAIHMAPAHADHPALTFTGSIAGNVVMRSPSLTVDGGQFRESSFGVYVHDDASARAGLYLSSNCIYEPGKHVWHPIDATPASSEVYHAGRNAPRLLRTNPFPYTGAEPYTAGPDAVKARVIEAVGKHPGQRDSIDRDIIQSVRRREGVLMTLLEDRGPDPWAAVDVRNTRKLELPSNPEGDDDNDGYTNLEEWLHAWSAYVEGRTDSLPDADFVTADLESHQTKGVVAGLPVFFQQLHDRVTHPMSWSSGGYSDISEWKRVGRERVRSAWLTPPPDAAWNPKLIAEEDRGTHVARKIVFNITGDSRVLAYLTVPKGEGPFPAVLLLHDHGGRFDIGKEKVVRPFAVPRERLESAEEWVERLFGKRFLADELSKRGYVCFVTDALNWGDRGGGGGDKQDAIASNLMHLGMSFAGLIAWEDARAAQFLSAQSEVDPGRVAAMGLSLGGFRAWQVSAMSDDIAVGISVCWIGTVKSMMLPGQNQAKGSSAFTMLHPGLLADLDYPDIASLAAPKPMLFYSGRYDRLFAQSGVEVAFHKLRAVWEAEDAAERLETRTWNVEHVFDVPMQEAAFKWLDNAMTVRGDRALSRR